MVVTHGSLQRARGRCALTIGHFDGVHRGHRALVDRVVAKARETKLTPCVLTFEPHPREFFTPDAAPARITRLRDKLELMAKAGVEHVHVARFDARFAAMTAERFIDDVLVRGLGVAWQAAELAEAERLLGHPSTISGRVAHGATLGRGLGFPTANIVLRRAPPIGGIFVVEVDRYGQGGASVGRRPTVNPVAIPLLEVHLFEHDSDLYGEHLRVRFLKKLRDEEKYDGLPALQAAISRDARQAREYFLKHG